MVVVAMVATIALAGIGAAPALGAATASGLGSASVAPTTVVAPAASSLQFTFTTQEAMDDGVLTVTVPTGWTAPSTVNSTASSGTVAVVGSTITVSGLTLASDQTVTVTYGTESSMIVPPVVGGYDSFSVAMSPTSVGMPQPLPSSPLVFVYALASPTLFDQVSSVPLSVFNKVGVGSPQVPSSVVSILRDQPPFTVRDDGGNVPRTFFYGGEFCPYCGPASWGAIVALARFGSFSRLYEMFSSPTDIYPDTPGFTFHLSTYTSRYLTFTAYEVEDPFGEPLDQPPGWVQARINKYDAQGALPFIDIGNLEFLIGSPFDPAILAGATQDEIGANLTNPSNATTRAIVTFANYLTAGICATNHERPGTICRSAGVLEADYKLKLHRP